MSPHIRIVFGADGAHAISEDGTFFPLDLEDALTLLYGAPARDRQGVPKSGEPESSYPVHADRAVALGGGLIEKWRRTIQPCL
jgi:hypothetical protein